MPYRYNKYRPSQPSVRARVGSEEDLSFMLARYMNYKYPDIPYHFDFGSGLRMTMGQAVKNKRLNKRSWPDLFIAAKRHGKAGLFIELKKKNSSPFLKSGKLSTNQHVQEQADTLERLRQAGYEATFGVGYDNVVAIINKYLIENAED